MKKVRSFVRIGCLILLLVSSGWVVAKGGSRLIRAFRHPRFPTIEALENQTRAVPEAATLTYGPAELLDAAQSLYLIPVLQTPDSCCVNLLLYHQQAHWEMEDATPIFKQPLHLTSATIDGRTLYMAGTNEDSNHNGRFDATDLATLYVRSLADDRLHTLRLPGHTFLEYYPTPDPDVLLVKFGSDRNGNGRYEYGEPQTWHRYTYSTRKLRPVVR